MDTDVGGGVPPVIFLREKYTDNIYFLKYDAAVTPEFILFERLFFISKT